ncbi:HD-GYP domain-containing protein [Paenibacillus jilunlii]|uniref:Chemotaxis protein CheY n=1 Tax=Paenibacillus jilunlii TaxID=682956 RepID=A0A1G9IHB0_9BACL|nr:chemotaxis protein CheY [Paenibacillus jilunlii]SDL24435.1 HD-GYP domain, c-di-GMP phosphodiesterase class II (or its inactivated variant) [Paenibacillus jilunlii]
MNLYGGFLKKQIRNYIFGSVVAVLAVGSLILLSSLEISTIEYFRLLIILLISFAIMAVVEISVFIRQIRPIRTALTEHRPTLAKLEEAYLHTHRLPKLAVQRILGPHLLGLSLPASIMTLWMIRTGLISLPYFYLVLAVAGAILVACMHALIEFFLTSSAIIPLIKNFRNRALELHMVDFSLEGHVFVPIRPKFLITCMLIGTFPLVLFIMATQIRLETLGGRAAESMRSYWEWAGLVLLIGTLFSSIAAWLLTRSVQHPINELYRAMNNIKDGRLLQVQDEYSDEFSKLVAGFNMMVRGLQAREQQSRQLLDSYFTTLAVALDARDPYTAGHSLRVAEYSVIIGQLAGLTGQQLDNLRKSALLHDIGKIGVRDSVLFKEEELTEEEFDQIKSHPVLGENILRQIEPEEKMAPYLGGVRSHHERYDGKGYPDGLAGTAIPLHGRIIAVADAYDAMTSDRPYRKGMDHDRALAILEQGRGTQWDPEFAGLFLAYFGKTGKSDTADYPGRAG